MPKNLLRPIVEIVVASFAIADGRLSVAVVRRDAAPFATGQRRDVRVRGRAPQSIHRQLELGVEVPGIGRVNAILEPRLLVEDLVHFLGRHFFAELHVDGVVLLEIGRAHV